MLKSLFVELSELLKNVDFIMYLSGCNVSTYFEYNIIKEDRTKTLFFVEKKYFFHYNQNNQLYL